MELSSSTTVVRSGRRSFPWQGWVGALLVLTMWPANWLLPGIRTSWLFFPLWLGYALLVDGLVFMRIGTSLLTRSRQRYVGLFLVSIPVWWLFELINLRTQNWFYLGVEVFSPLEFFILSSIAFSVVIPAVFGTAELAVSFGFIRNMRPWLVIRDDRSTTLTFFVIGWGMLALMLLWPRYFFPFVWISVYFITEPLNVWLGNRSMVEYTRVGDWRPVVALFVGVLITGFFWEMWNYFSFPKWIYEVPGVGVAKVFEMPLLGYGGYLPFSLELFAVYHLIMGWTAAKRTEYITK